MKAHIEWAEGQLNIERAINAQLSLQLEQSQKHAQTEIADLQSRHVAEIAVLKSRHVAEMAEARGKNDRLQATLARYTEEINRLTEEVVRAKEEVARHQSVVTKATKATSVVEAAMASLAEIFNGKQPLNRALEGPVRAGSAALSPDGELAGAQDQPLQLTAGGGLNEQVRMRRSVRGPRSAPAPL